MSKIYQSIRQHLKNLPGRGVTSRVVAIECDDWGSIRMPSRAAYERLAGAGFDLDNRYDRFDTLEDATDLAALFEVLTSVRDARGVPCVMTPLVTVANPDFEAMRHSGFREFVFEPYPDTLNKYGRDPQVAGLWREGLEKGFFIPEYHGHSHMTVPQWWRMIIQGHRKLRKAFDQGYVAVNLADLSPEVTGFRAELFFEEPSQIPFISEALGKGILRFRELFGRAPRLFVPTNGIFHPLFKKDLLAGGICYFYLPWKSWMPNGRGGLQKSYHFEGTHRINGIACYSRNCLFEPSEQGYAGIEATLGEIAAAFRCHKPAIISSHRVNFCGGLSPQNRGRGLSELKKLLTAIVRRWPDVQFMGTADLLKHLFRD